MNQGKKPHSRDKKIMSGTSGVKKGQQINTGTGPVGGNGSFGNRASGSGSGGFPSGGRTPMRASLGGGALPLKLNLKTILILAAIVIVGIILLKACGGSLLDFAGSGSGFGGNENEGQNYEDDPNTPLNYSVSPLAREKRVDVSDADSVTVMVYMCGTDLESKYGMATKDLSEMMKAEISDNLHIYVETGGCNQWQNNVVSENRNQIYQVKTGGLSLLEDNVGNMAMTEPSNLAEFIRYCAAKDPDSRKILIFWDHGGGSLSGYGYDEKHSDASSMTLSRIHSALKAADCTFDFIGFDACLMATLETALVCNDYADYLLASEETEPGTGWQYTRFLTALSENPKKPTVEVAKTVIDDFISASTASSSGAKVTLSLIDLAELQGTVPDAFSEFASSTNALLQSDGYAEVSEARAGVRQFSQSSKINQVDLVDLSLRIGTKESKALADALRGCVKYNRSSISRCYGVSIYFPYESTKSVNSAVASYQEIGIDSEYTKCIRSFASLSLGGQVAGGATQVSGSGGGTDLLDSLLSSLSSGTSSTSPLSILTGGFSSGGTQSAGYGIDASAIAGLLSGFSGRSMPSGYEWVDKDLITASASKIAGNFLDPSRVTATKENGRSVLRLSEEEWALVSTVELNVFSEDGEDFIDLGYDNTFTMDGNDLLLTFDGTWLTLNGNVCAYYLLSDTEGEDGSYTTVGRIPALLNGQTVDLQVVFDKTNPYGTVTGAYPMYESGKVDVQAKGCLSVKAGDEITLLCDCYRADGTYTASYTLGERFTVGNDGLSLANRTIIGDRLRVTYRLTDIYGNRFWIDVD